MIRAVGLCRGATLLNQQVKPVASNTADQMHILVFIPWASLRDRAKDKSSMCENYNSGQDSANLFPKSRHLDPYPRGSHFGHLSARGQARSERDIAQIRSADRGQFHAMQIENLCN
ncbi:MAG TPA: hypothetical protein VF988_02760 [Verrucomicrobiae bacterium]